MTIDTDSRRDSLAIRLAVGRLRRRLREVTSTDDVSSTQISVLSRLTKGEADTAAALAALENVSPQSMAMTIKLFEERGLVRRSPDPGDARRQIVTVTAEGADFNEGLRAERNEWLAQAISDTLTEAERQTLREATDLIERIAGA